MASATPGYLGPYRLLNVVHTGQTSQIWQAYHDGQQRIFGIKTLLSKFHRDREHVQYLRWEYVVGHKLEHERVIRVFAFEVSRGTPYVALEWFPASNMKQRIQQGVEPIAHLLPKVITQAAEGLAYFNGQGWVHRDVKPDNFLVTDQGDVKLIDFALARRAASGLRRLLSTKSKIQGTRSYMSPEQIRGGALDLRADVYSLGCTIYQLLSGRPPYTGSSADELLRKHLKSPPPAVEAINKNITPEFGQLLRRMLAKEPSDRPQSVQDFLREFQMMRLFKRTPLPPEGVGGEKSRSTEGGSNG